MGSCRAQQRTGSGCSLEAVPEHREVLQLLNPLSKAKGTDPFCPRPQPDPGGWRSSAPVQFVSNIL